MGHSATDNRTDNRRHPHFTPGDIGIGKTESEPAIWPDSEILKRATELGRTVLTLNRRDFIRLHKQNPNHSGIIACTQNLDFAELANQIHTAIATEGALAARLIRVYRPQAQ